MRKTILLTGGAGYIGSHTAYLLNRCGYRVVIIDDLLHEQPFSHSWVHLKKGNLNDQKLLNEIFSENDIHAVMHFAGFIEVGESVKRPAMFYHNNVALTLQLLDVMRDYGVDKFIFSSSCAVYGEPVYTPIDEKHQLVPSSPYGKTKLVVEFALQDYAAAYGLSYVALRYFNAAGALPEHGLGEWHKPETHIIPLLLRAIQQNKPFCVFGNDYKTPDGTCIRDYIHVLDIAQAHISALQYLDDGGISDVFNLGTGTGYSVKQLFDVVQDVTSCKINKVDIQRRPGDTAVLVANSKKAGDVLTWRPQHSNLEDIVRSAWTWEQKRFGYREKTFKEKQIMP